MECQAGLNKGEARHALARAVLAMPVVCSACGAKGRGGKGFGFARRGGRISATARSAGTTEAIWSEA